MSSEKRDIVLAESMLALLLCGILQTNILFIFTYFVSLACACGVDTCTLVKVCTRQSKHAVRAVSKRGVRDYHLADNTEVMLSLTQVLGT